MRVRRSRRSGYSLAETLVAAGISTMILYWVINLLILTMSSWGRGENWTEVENGSRVAIRRMQTELREAMRVRIDGDGMGLTYQLPTKKLDGEDVIPLQADGIDRRIALVGSDLMMGSVGDTRVAMKNVITTDPFLNTSTVNVGSAAQLAQAGIVAAVPYRIFTPGAGSVLRQIQVKVVTSLRGAKTEKVFGRKREIVFLRNVPIITR